MSDTSRRFAGGAAAWSRRISGRPRPMPNRPATPTFSRSRRWTPSQNREWCVMGRVSQAGSIVFERDRGLGIGDAIYRRLHECRVRRDVRNCWRVGVDPASGVSGLSLHGADRRVAFPPTDEITRDRDREDYHTAEIAWFEYGGVSPRECFSHDDEEDADASRLCPCPAKVASENTELLGSEGTLAASPLLRERCNRRPDRADTSEFYHRPERAPSGVKPHHPRHRYGNEQRPAEPADRPAQCLRRDQGSRVDLGAGVMQDRVVHRCSIQ